VTNRLPRSWRSSASTGAAQRWWKSRIVFDNGK
jgi:hypothetical protein